MTIPVAPTKNLFEKVYSYENLYNAYLKAKRGKGNIKEVLEFTYNLESELLNLQYELKNQVYKTGNYRHFIIFEPKKEKFQHCLFGQPPYIHNAPTACRLP